MVDFKYRPKEYFESGLTSVLLIRLDFPESQWGEVISIYANLLNGMIHFEAVDFYGNDINLSPAKSLDPLSTQEVIYMLETMEADWENSHGNLGLTLLGIPEVDSKYYPELKKYFSEKRKGFGLD